jgi:hypothetical protein
VYLAKDAMALSNMLASLPEANRVLCGGIRPVHLGELATALTDGQAAQELSEARQLLFLREPARTR